MGNMDNVIKELDDVGKQILAGEYDNADEIIGRYKALKKKLEDAGVQILDGINFNSLLPID